MTPHDLPDIPLISDDAADAYIVAATRLLDLSLVEANLSEVRANFQVAQRMAASLHAVASDHLEPLPVFRA